MAIIDRVELSLVELTPKVRRTDAIQSFVSQETPIVRVFDRDDVVARFGERVLGDTVAVFGERLGVAIGLNLHGWRAVTERPSSQLLDTKPWRSSR